MSVLSLENTLRTDVRIGTTLNKELNKERSFINTAQKVTIFLLAAAFLSSASLLFWLPAVVGLGLYSNVLDKTDSKVVDVLSGKTTASDAADSLCERQVHLFGQSYMRVYEATRQFIADTTSAFSCNLDSFFRRA